MVKLEEIQPGVRLQGLMKEPVKVEKVEQLSEDAILIIYSTAEGDLRNEILYRDHEAKLEILPDGADYSLEADGALFRLTAEALRIHHAHLFDPYLAVHTSLIEPLPHQLTAVYEHMLPRTPLRFLLADDPGAGKTIMAGLLIKELITRGEVQRCLICCPGNLVEQWQEELESKFGLPFEIVGREAIQQSLTGNPYQSKSLVISRMDMIARSDELMAKLRQTEWDLVVIDEAHKMHASFYGNEVKETKRYKLGRLLSERTQHLLLLTATPHNGKEAEFQLFLALLDPERFAGRFQTGVPSVDIRDIMRRVVKEDLLRFDGTRLFPERFAHTVAYSLSPEEKALYEAVTNYVRHEMDRADRLTKKQKNLVGFALTTLQRRLASSPEAIYQSLRRRRERLEKRLQEETQRSQRTIDTTRDLEELTEDLLDDIEQNPDPELEQLVEQILDQASTARTVHELQQEIEKLRDLEAQALQVRNARTDRKWDELSRLLQTHEAIVDPHGNRRKLVIFTEHLDTLRYLHERLLGLLGRREALVCIHGGMSREERRQAQEQFLNDPETQILLATDAAGEGINLQRAHLMVNYDLPWNPNRLEQRFGRIHRIGQTEVCHMWNLVAEDTREGEVFLRLLIKLEQQRNALGGQVFDVLGKLFRDKPLRELLIEAIRYGEQPEVRQKLFQKVDTELDITHLRQLIEERALITETYDWAYVQRERERLAYAETHRLHPHYIASFFIEAFRRLGGTIHEREPQRYAINHVPAEIRQHPTALGTKPILQRYERVTFHKERIHQSGAPRAELLAPGHPLVDAVTSLILQKFGSQLEQGAILVDPRPTAPPEPRLLFLVELEIQDGRTDRSGNRVVVSRQLHFVEIDPQGNARFAGYAPHLDYRPLKEEERALVQPLLQAPWLQTTRESTIIQFAIKHLIPRHRQEVEQRLFPLLNKQEGEVRRRLQSQIDYWYKRAQELERREREGKPSDRLNSAQARERAKEYEQRLVRRLNEIDQQRQLSLQPPRIRAVALIVPERWLTERQSPAEPPLFAQETEASERLAMEAVMAYERALGNEPSDVSHENRGYDILSRTPEGHYRLIEVKGRVAGAETVTLTRNEILTALNNPDHYYLAIVPIEDGKALPPRYYHQPFRKEPDFSAHSVNYLISKLDSSALSRHSERSEESL